MTNTKQIDKSTLRELAVAASCDPRTVELVLLGAPVRGMARRRALAAIVAKGISVPQADGGVER